MYSIPSINVGTVTYDAIQTISSYFSKNMIFQKNFFEMLSLNTSVSGENNIYSDSNNDSNWYLNWLGDGNQNVSKLDEYHAIFDVLFNDDYKTYFPFAETIGQYLFLKFLNTKIYKLNSNRIYVQNNVYPFIVSPGRLNYSPMQDVLHLFFLRSRGMLNSFLSKYSSGLSRQEIASSDTIMSWVGCFSPDLTYKDENGNIKNIFSQSTDPVSKNNKPCDPLCYGINKIQLVDENGSNLLCNGTICVLSDITINSNSTNLTFNQVCPGCSTSNQNCLCIVDKSIPGVLSKVEGTGNSDSFKQNCPNATCIVYNPKTGDMEVTKCDSDETQQTNDLSSKIFSKITFFGLEKYIPKEVIIIGIILIVVLIIFTISNKKSDNK